MEFTTSHWGLKRACTAHGTHLVDAPLLQLLRQVAQLAVHLPRGAQGVPPGLPKPHAASQQHPQAHMIQTQCETLLARIPPSIDDASRLPRRPCANLKLAMLARLAMHTQTKASRRGPERPRHTRKRCTRTGNSGFRCGSACS